MNRQQMYRVTREVMGESNGDGGQKCHSVTEAGMVIGAGA